MIISVEAPEASANIPDGVCIVAHSREAQRLMDEKRIAWGVQYEIARGVSCGWWSWQDVTSERLENLRGSNRDAVLKIPQVFPRPSKGGGMSQSDLQLWAELDREELAILERRSRGLGLPEQRGLGLQDDWEEAKDWYGGKIQQVARIEEAPGRLRLVLAPMEMRKSTRFARFLGSRRILQISIPSGLRVNRADELKEFLTTKFVLCGRVFVAFGSKEGKLFLMETKEDYERGPLAPGDDQRMSLEDFVAWHNPMAKNGKQAVSKWSTRFDLGLSISVPALFFERNNMFYIADEVVHKEFGRKALTHEIYTDGCGFMSGSALCAIGQRMGFPGRPTAVQGRISGAKGVWLLHPRIQDPNGPFKIWTRESQNKILLDYETLDPAHCIFDLVAPPRVIIPSRLSRLTVLNLAHNGIPTSVFEELMKETLFEQVRALTQWTHPRDMQILWATINRIGHVVASRVQQYALGASRALGISGRIREDHDDFPSDEPSDPLQDLLSMIGDSQFDDEEVVAMLAEIESAGAVPQRLRDPHSGTPLSIHGAVMDLLQAGFHPLKLPILYDKLKKITRDVIEDVINEFHISIPLSAEAFIVPDPYGVLEEGQIHFKSTKELKPPLNDLNPNILLGEVLVYRNPVRLPSDVQKVVTAVQHELLANYTDVVVFPTKGPCSLASKLAGGDYDGDVCVCVYDPRLVNAFVTPPLSTQAPDFLKTHFEDQGKIEQVHAVAAEISTMGSDRDARRKRLQGALLSDLSNPPVGAYSVFHENAVYTRGYDDPETQRIAHMFNTILDSRKSGLRVKEDVYRADKRVYDRGRPKCLPSKVDADPISTPYNRIVLRRPPTLPRFVLEVLQESGEDMRDKLLSSYDALRENAGLRDNDPDLLQPYAQAATLSDHPVFGPHLTIIKEHVRAHILQWQNAARESKPSSPSKARRAKARSSARSSAMSEKKRWRDLGQSFASGPQVPPDSPLVLLGSIEAIVASCAYTMNAKFAWSVAFQPLCKIKAARQGSIGMAGHFADSMAISSSAVRVFEQSRSGMS
ncbi:RNA dependent RNA polymerase-domain-containing protein [Cubamyces lactineus]|nr:RNA dependent RNA polymerase-domain-containing protein [Cubamyces lactineus]